MICSTLAVFAGFNGAPPPHQSANLAAVLCGSIVQNIYIFTGLAVNESKVVAVTAVRAVIKAAVKQDFTSNIAPYELAPQFFGTYSVI